MLLTLEIVKFFQGIFMEWEHRMYYVEQDLPANVQSCNLNEELGQVEYIFSDKTGTLTCNQMIFRKFTTGPFSYGSNEDGVSTVYSDKAAPMNNVNVFDEHTIFSQLNSPSCKHFPFLKSFLLHLALCNTVVIDPKTGKYNASSPDELALIMAAKHFGAELVSKDEENVITIRFQKEEY